MFYTVKVELQSEDDKGKIKKIKESKLVEAVSVSDAETKVAELFDGSVMEHEVIGAAVSNIDEVVLDKSTLENLLRNVK